MRRDEQVALEGARSGMVLLKNDGNLLPLDKGKIKSIAVIGPDAYPAQPVGGGSGAVQPFAAVSFLQGIANYLGSGRQGLLRGRTSDAGRDGEANQIHHRSQRRQGRPESRVLRQRKSFRQAGHRARGQEGELRSGRHWRRGRERRFDSLDRLFHASHCRATTWLSFRARERTAATGCISTRRS